MTVYKIYPFSAYAESHFSDLVRGQRDIYPDEPEVRREDLVPFFRNSFVISAEDGGRVVGYSVFCICQNSRNSLLFGSNLYLWVEPEKRDSAIGGNLIVRTEILGKSLGCTEFKWDVLTDSPLVQMLEKRAKYKKESIIFTRKLV